MNLKENPYILMDSSALNMNIINFNSTTKKVMIDLSLN
jgi:hypothetical protein